MQNGLLFYEAFYSIKRDCSDSIDDSALFSEFWDGCWIFISDCPFGWNIDSQCYAAVSISKAAAEIVLLVAKRPGHQFVTPLYFRYCKTQTISIGPNLKSEDTAC
jgi:hypothetical protein